jgi:pyruvate/2-oxoglutarate dehydrogenase complex dihydrolipoamide acyltransferase (E2) component
VTETPCPHCGEPADPRQLVCLNCGGRIALRERAILGREPLPAAALVFILLAATSGLLVGLGISSLSGGDADGGGGAAQPASATAPQATAERTNTAAAQPEAPAVVGGGKQEQQTRTRETGVPGWPKGLTAHTVVLVNSSDRAAAMNVAKQARASGLEAGLIRSDPYDLGSGLWIVYSGRFTTPEGAQKQASQLAGRYPGAYPQLIQSSQ